MLPMPIIQLAGGILMAVLLTNSSLTQINNKISQRAIIQQEEIQEEIDEFNEEYSDFESAFIEDYIRENNIITKLTEEDINEIKDEALSAYTNYNRFNISNKTLDYMKNQLPEHIKEKLNRNEHFDGYTPTQRITWYYFRQELFKDKFEWLKK